MVTSLFPTEILSPVAARYSATSQPTMPPPMIRTLPSSISVHPCSTSREQHMSTASAASAARPHVREPVATTTASLLLSFIISGVTVVPIANITPAFCARRIRCLMRPVISLFDGAIAARLSCPPSLSSFS